MKAHWVLSYEAPVVWEGLHVEVVDGVRKIEIEFNSTTIVSMIGKKCVALCKKKKKKKR